MNNILLIVNPNSGQGKIQSIIGSIQQKLQKAFEEVTIYETKQPGDATRYIQNNASEVDCILISGGDGSVHEAINALAPLEQRPVLGILPGGTCNDFSRAIGLKQDPLDAIDQLLNGDIRAIDIGASNDEYFTNFWGAGLMTEASTNVDAKAKQNLGRLSYYLSAAKSLGNHEPFHLTVSADDGYFDDEAVMLVVGNGPFTGGISAFFPESDIEDGLLDVLIVKEASLKTLWAFLHSTVTNKFPDNEEGIIYFQTNHLDVSTPDHQLIDCDGERNYHTPSSVRTLPGHLQVAVGDIDKVK